MASHPHAARDHSTLLKFAVFTGVAVILYVAREICIPFALAILLAFLLAPVVTRLQKFHFPHTLAVLTAMLMVVILIVAVGWLVLSQFVQLAEQLPQYRSTVHEKLGALHTKPGGTFDQLNRTFNDYANEVAAITSQPAQSQPAASQPSDSQPATSPSSASQPATPGVAATPTAPPESAPSDGLQPAPPGSSLPKSLAVTVTQPRMSGLDVLRTAMLGVLHPLLVLGVVLILTAFILIQWQDVRDRLLRLVGRGQLQTSTKTLDDAGDRVSRYLLMQMAVNIVFGFCIFAGLFFIGVPNSPLWGLVAAALRFLPYFGVPAAAIPPVILSFVTGHGFAGMLITLALFACLEILTGYVVEPWLYGSKTGISPLAILGSALFWAWIWGPVGLLLSTPLTVCLAVLGRHVPSLSFLQVIFGDEPALTPELRFYQRLLAGDQDEATAIAEAKLNASSPLKLYDDLLLPALLLAERDRRRNDLDDDTHHALLGFISAMIDDVEDRAPTVTNESGPTALCMPASSDADALAARMLAAQLRRLGVRTTLLGVETLAGEGVQHTQDLQPDVVCISALPPQAILHARYLAKRLRTAHPQVRLLVGLWGSTEEKSSLENCLPPSLVNGVVSTISATADQIALQRSTEAHPELATSATPH